MSTLEDKQSRAADVLNSAIKQIESGNIQQGCDTLISVARLLDDINRSIIREYHTAVEGCKNYGGEICEWDVTNIVKIKEAVRILRLNRSDDDVNVVLRVLRGHSNFPNILCKKFLIERYTALSKGVNVGELEL